jgi:ABC-type oligopeptide transport system substrate-binding subunit/class 3 adenylate cyclase/tetratricopeptide (TPR) repeat protein
MMDERQRIEQAIAAQESLRASLGDEIVDETISTLREKLAHLETPEQQRKLVTILYADIVGSTNIVKHLDPEDALEIMDGSLKRLATPVEKNCGHVARFMGDGFKAIFGMPKAYENDPEMAIKAGLGILEVAQEIASELEAQWSIRDFQVRVGINTGLAALGGMTEAEDTVMGSMVNLTKRVESAAPPGGLLITQNTYRHVRGVFTLRSQEPIEAKGFDEPVPVYLVLRVKPRAFRVQTRGVEGVETRMVGRKGELIALQEAYRNAIEGEQTQVVTVVGEAGVGKSRLLYEFQNWLDLHPDEPRFFQGRGRQETQFQPYALLKDVFTFRFQIQESDKAIEVRNKVGIGFSEVFGGDDEGNMHAHIIGQLLGFDFSKSHHVLSVLDDPQQIHDHALMYLAEYFQGMSDQAPTVVFLEDIHWADDSSLDMLNRMARKIPEQRLLIVCVARHRLYERRPHWGEGLAYHRRLELQPLSNLDSSQLVMEILQKVDQIPDSLQDLVVKGAEGNPFYIEELVKMLIDDGVVITGEVQWQIEPERLAGVDVPDTLTGVLQARLEGLPQEERNTLQQASVVGHIFWDDTVEYISNESSLVDTQSALRSTDETLSSLRSRELIYHHEESAFTAADEYTFKHAVLRDVTYESVLKRLRSIYHGLVAEWLIQHSEERAVEYTGLIADHLELAGKTEQAITYLLQAGDQARKLYAHQEAINHYQRALELLKESGNYEHAARTLMKLGLTYHNAFDFKAARRAYEEGSAQSQRVMQTESAVLLPAPHALRVEWVEPETLDPAIANHPSSVGVVDHLFSGLARLTPEMDVVPEVARDWDVLEGGRKYIFHLRDDVHWSDGMPVTAYDFEYAWKRTLNPATGSPNACASLLYDIKGARTFHQGEASKSDGIGAHALDADTLVVELEEPTAYFLYLLTLGTTCPVPRRVVEAHGDAWTEVENIVTNGPFRLEARQPGHSIVMERNPEYFGRSSGNVQRVELSVLSDFSNQLAQYATDRLDVFWSFVELTPSDRDRTRQRYAGEYTSAPTLQTSYVGFNMDRSPFDDMRVRRAFVLATDRETLADIIMRGYTFPATGGFVPPGMPGHSAGIALPYDPARARQVLTEAGYSGGRGFPVVELLGWRGNEPICEYLGAQWRDNLGIEITWKTMEFSILLPMLDDALPCIFINGWQADYPDPHNFLMPSSVLNSSRWRNKVYEGLVEEARRITDHGERMDLYRQADKILVEEAGIMPLMYGRKHLLVKPWVRKYPVSAIHRSFWKDVIIEPHQVMG